MPDTSAETQSRTVTAGGSARRQYDRRRAADAALVRSSLSRTVPVFIIAVVAGYLLARLGISLFDSAMAKAVTKGSTAAPTPAIPAAEGTFIAFAVAAATALSTAKVFWARRQTTAAWRAGAEGEERLARRLQELEADGYRVLHDRSIPGSRANIDHLVIGPTGTYVVDAKNFNGRLTFSKGVLWHGKYPLTRKLQTTAWEAAQVQEHLSRAVWTVQVRVVPLMCILGAEMPRPAMDLEGVRVIKGGRRLNAEIRRCPAVLDEEVVAAIAELADHAFPPAGP